MKISVKANTTQANTLFQNAQQVSERSVQQAFQYFRGITPEASDNAKKNTTVDVKNKTITANYAYAGVLDAGRRSTAQGMRGSQQAPNGMSGPTLKELDRIINKEIGKL